MVIMLLFVLYMVIVIYGNLYSIKCYLMLNM